MNFEVWSFSIMLILINLFVCLVKKKSNLILTEWLNVSIVNFWISSPYSLCMLVPNAASMLCAAALGTPALPLQQSRYSQL